MHTPSTRIDDEIALFANVEIVPRRWCAECHRKSMFRYDQFGYPICLEHADEEEVFNA